MMSKRKIIFLCSLLLLFSFSGQLIFSVALSSPVAIEMDADGDTEKEESREECKEASLFFARHAFIPNHRNKPTSFIVSCRAHHWTNPILEIQSPPPKAS